jgi:hypothetical protein
MDSRNPLKRSGKQESNAILLYNRSGNFQRFRDPPTRVQVFEFYRFRFWFEAVDAVRFPPGLSANVLRGALGTHLLEADAPTAYRSLFQPGGGGVPSGLADWPRPFVLRCAHLDGATFAPGTPFFFDAHVFELRRPVLASFRAAFHRAAEAGLGLGRGRARLTSVEQLDLAGHPELLEAAAPCSISLDGPVTLVNGVTLRFATPTELKGGGRVTDRPEFTVLFGRIRDRIGNLRALYSRCALDVDFRALGERAAQVRLVRCDLAWEYAARKSTRTGLTHPLGGFTGEAEYDGELGEFLPWLRAAQWVGVGRQTVWGKGEVRIQG